MNNEERARFEKEFPVPRNVWWNPEWCGEGRYEPVNSLLQRDSPESAFMQQQRWMGWRTAASSNSKELHHLRDATKMIALAAGADNEYSQGIMSDGPVILKNGQPMTPEDIVVELSVLQATHAQDGGEPVAWRATHKDRIPTLFECLQDAKLSFGFEGCEIAPLYTHPSSAVVPEGWKLVPVEPTIDMVEMGGSKAMRGMDFERAQAVWKEMLRWSPKAPKPPEQEQES